MRLWNLKKLSTSNSRATRQSPAHLTFAKSKLGTSLSRAGATIKRQFWLWPIIAMLVLSVIGFFVHGSISSTMKTSLKSELQTLLNVESSMLENWYTLQESAAESIAKDAEVREAVLGLVSQVSAAALPTAEAPAGDHLVALDRRLTAKLDHREHKGYMLIDRDHRVIAASSSELVGKQHVAQFNEFVTQAIDGNVAVSAPFPSPIALKDASGNYRAGTPVMFVAAPIRDSNLQIMAVLALRIPPEKEFTRIMQIGRLGESGETYAFNKDGVMVSNSRFDHQLILNGLLADQPDSQSILNLQLRDPGGDMTQGYRPERRRTEMPLTRMAAAATSGDSGVDVEGYSDYRGVSVVGAWQWLPRYNIGIATEIDSAEAYHPLTILSRMFWGLYSLLFIASVAILIFSLIVGRMQREAQKAAIEARELGQYRLEEKLGAGAMGIVYKGYHAMMRRPTAIKLLNVDSISESAISRFEREVQITCLLNHPNTIAIYDYGRTPEGIFYYAMEFLDGIDLQKLVDEYGTQPEARVIQILIQICGSLYEAHAQGLVHRDIKPANIMLNRRGGQPDVVKVLDFGLVKQVEGGDKEVGLAGTPLYMSPEAIQTPSLVDACSDIYAVGAVGYFLVTGKSVFEAPTLVDLIQKHVSEPPLPPSQRVNADISADFENVILSCLEKSRARRPQTARDLAQALLHCQSAQKWSQLDAENWWSSHDRRKSPGPQTLEASKLRSSIRTVSDATVAATRGDLDSQKTVANTVSATSFSFSLAPSVEMQDPAANESDPNTPIDQTILLPPKQP